MTLDPQKIFNKAVKGLHKQGGPSRGHLGWGCVYYNPETQRRCGAGLVFTKDELKKIPDELNGRGINILMEHGVLSHYKPVVTLLSSIQKAHDSAAYDPSTNTWKGNDIAKWLIKVAVDHKLDYAIVTELFSK